MLCSLVAQFVDDLLRTRAGQQLTGLIGNLRLVTQTLDLCPLLIGHRIGMGVQDMARSSIAGQRINDGDVPACGALLCARDRRNHSNRPSVFFRPEVSGGLRMKGRNQQRGAGAGETERAIMIRCMVVAFAAAGLSVSLIYSLA